MAAVLGEGLTQDQLMILESVARSAHHQLLEQLCRSLDISEEKGDRADRQRLDELIRAVFHHETRSATPPDSPFPPIGGVSSRLARFGGAHATICRHTLEERRLELEVALRLFDGLDALRSL